MLLIFTIELGKNFKKKCVGLPNMDYLIFHCIIWSNFRKLLAFIKFYTCTICTALKYIFNEALQSILDRPRDKLLVKYNKYFIITCPPFLNQNGRNLSKWISVDCQYVMYNW